MRRHRQAPLAEEVVRLRLPGQLEALAVADPVDQHVQRPRRRDAGVLLPQRPGGAVARVGERRPSRRHEGRVELLEAFDGEEHLAADLDLGRVTGSLQSVRDALDGLDVVGDVLTGTPVAAGQGPGQPAVLVEQVDREAVDLQLAQVVVVGRVGVAGRPRGPGGQLLGREAVVEAEHPLEVVDGLELGRERRPSDQLGRALRGAQRGVLLLQLVEPPDHPVVVGVAEGRRVAHVVVELRRERVLRDLGPLVERLGRYARGLGRRRGPRGPSPRPSCCRCWFPPLPSPPVNPALRHRQRRRSATPRMTEAGGSGRNSDRSRTVPVGQPITRSRNALPNVRSGSTRSRSARKSPRRG